MNKNDLVVVMSEKAGISKADATKALNAFTDSIKDILGKNDKIALLGFGTFSVTERAARKGRNPQTGAEIDIPAAKVPKFKAGAELKATVKQTSAST